MLTKPPLSPSKPDPRVIRLGPRTPSPIAQTPLAKHSQMQPVEPLDRRQVRLRWD